MFFYYMNNDKYLLMNKNNIVGVFQKEDSLFEGDSSYKMLSYNKEQLPIGFVDITSWLEGRKASKHNEHLRDIMERLNCSKTEGFIRVTHATSINDTFWVKKENEQVEWKNISLYQNEFTESISALALEGVGLYNEIFSPTALPEFVSEGSFPKCFTKENGFIYIYKGGSVKYINSGMEPYSETLASEIANFISDNAVSYKLSKLHGKLASKCLLFTDETYGYTPYRNLIEKGKIATLNETYRYFTSLGSEKEFREMLLIDAITFNTDRHMGNYGVLFNNDSLKINKIAPIFDLNLSLFPYLMINDFQNIGDHLLRYSPVLGEDFTRLGQQMITPALKEKVSMLTDYTFKFRGDKKFTEDRIKILEKIIQQQAKAILKNQRLETKDVFIPETANEIKIKVKEKSAELNHLADKIEALNLPILISIDNNSEKSSIIIEHESNGFSMECDLLNHKITCFMDFKEIDISNYLNNKDIYPIYQTIHCLFFTKNQEQLIASEHYSKIEE